MKWLILLGYVRSLKRYTPHCEKERRTTPLSNPASPLPIPSAEADKNATSSKQHHQNTKG